MKTSSSVAPSVSVDLTVTVDVPALFCKALQFRYWSEPNVQETSAGLLCETIENVQAASESSTSELYG